MRHRRILSLLLVTVLLTWGLRLEATYMASNHCDRDTGGVSLPAGFCATVFADHLGVARHIAVAADGDVYVALRERVGDHGIAALQDSHGSGHADVVRGFGDAAGSGIAMDGGYLYFASD